MELSAELILFIGSVLFMVSMIIGKAGHKFGVPVLLLFLFVGMIFGGDGFGLKFENIQIAQTIGTICLTMILFSGGLDTKYQDIKPVIKPGVILATVGVLLTALFSGVFIWWLSENIYAGMGGGLLMALLLAATVSSTDSASVFGILRSKNLTLKNNLKPLLELESGSNDPMAYMLTFTLIEIISLRSAPNYFMVAFTILIQLSIGVFMGFSVGKLAVMFINRIKMDNVSLYPVLLLIIGVFIFSATYYLHGNGYLAVYIAGLVIGNSKFAHKRTSMKFMDGFAWFSQILLFLTLGLLVNPHELVPLIIPSLVIALFMIFVARPLTVHLCLLFFRNFSFKDKSYVSWVGLRGAVPIIFAIMPLAADVPGARTIFNIVFIITIASLLIQGTTLPFVARCLGLAEQPVENKVFEDFDIEVAEEIKSAMTEIAITKQTLEHGKNLLELPLPDKTLAVMVKRGDRFFVPNGQTELKVEDKLLVITDDEDALRETYRNIGISDFSYQKNE